MGPGKGLERSRLAQIRPRLDLICFNQDKAGEGQRRKTSCCHTCLLPKAALYLLLHCLQLGGHHPDLADESIHWEGEKHTCLLLIQRDICARRSKRLTHTKGLPLLPSPLETDKKGSFLVSTKQGGCVREENTHSPKLLT